MFGRRELTGNKTLIIIREERGRTERVQYFPLSLSLSLVTEGDPDKKCWPSLLDIEKLN